MPVNRSETFAHQQLKRLAVRHLQRSGALAVACEVACPISRYRVDVAGYQDRPPLDDDGQRPRHRVPPRTILIECKQSRADFLRDERRTDALLAQRDDLHQLRASIEEQQIKVWEPELRETGGSLFAEMERWDFTASQSPGYRRVIAKIRRVEKQLHGETKFCMIAQWRLADALYIAAPRGMIRRAEVPRGWGLLECPRDALQPGADLVDVRFRETVAARALHAAAQHRLRLLRNIAVTASFAGVHVDGLASLRRPRRTASPG